MDEAWVEMVAAQMRRLGLDDEVFDPAETAADLEERSTMNAGLDALLGSAPPPDPTAFDPRWLA
jgi:hypothetical protein